MADPDTRTLHFTTPFSMEASSAECRALSAPGLRERFGVVPKANPLKRPHSEIAESSESAVPVTPSAKKRARKQANKQKALANQAAQMRPPPQPSQLALEDRRPPNNGSAGGQDPKGKGKGKGKLPKGIKFKK